MILFDQIWSMDLMGWFSCVVTIRVSHPFDQVVELL
jgi:hypothetical protein